METELFVLKRRQSIKYSTRTGWTKYCYNPASNRNVWTNSRLNLEVIEMPKGIAKQTKEWFERITTIPRYEYKLDEVMRWDKNLLSQS